MTILFLQASSLFFSCIEHYHIQVHDHCGFDCQLFRRSKVRIVRQSIIINGDRLIFPSSSPINHHVSIKGLDHKKQSHMAPIL